MSRWRRDWEDGASERLPVDVYPCSNGEFIPPAPTAQQRQIMALAEDETERWRRRFGMSRRDFVRSAAAMSIGLWAVDAVTGGRFGRYAQGHNSRHDDACDLEWAGGTELATLSNLPGEFIFDVQSHHVDPEGLWRANNPGIHAAFALLWPQAGPLGRRPGTYDDGTPHGFGAGELDPIQNLSRFHYLKELYLDSATTMCVLSAVPSAPDLKQPLPIAEAAETVETVNNLSLPSARRCVMHAFVMPNRGSAGDTNFRDLGQESTKPLFLQEELDTMESLVLDPQVGPMLGGWKIYCPWGDVPNASGWFMDSENIGMPLLAQIQRLHTEHGGPRVLATHKGFALPGFDQRAAAPADVGPAAATAVHEFPDVKFLVYHSGHDLGAGPQGPYPGDDNVADDARSVDAFIRTLRLNGVDASSSPDGNSPNVYAELGSVWRDYMGNADSASHLIGKLVKHVGPKRVIWGTDSLWYGSPHREIVALRSLEMTDDAKTLYGLEHGLDSDVNDFSINPAGTPTSIRNAIFGYNAAEAYGIGDVDQIQRTMSCDAVNDLRQGYILDAGTERERATYASNQMTGARSRREFLTEWRNKPWAP